MEKGIQTPMAQGRSTTIIQKMWWFRTCKLSIKNCLSVRRQGAFYAGPCISKDSEVELVDNTVPTLNPKLVPSSFRSSHSTIFSSLPLSRYPSHPFSLPLSPSLPIQGAFYAAPTISKDSEVKLVDETVQTLNPQHSSSEAGSYLRLVH